MSRIGTFALGAMLATAPALAEAPVTAPDPATLAANRRVEEGLKTAAAQETAVQAEYRRQVAETAAKARAQEEAHARDMAAWQAKAAASASAMEEWKRTEGGKLRPRDVAVSKAGGDAGRPSDHKTDGEIVVNGNEVCKMRGGQAVIGSLIARSKPKRVCYNKAELAKNESETARDLKEFLTPKAGNIYQP